MTRRRLAGIVVVVVAVLVVAIVLLVGGRSAVHLKDEGERPGPPDGTLTVGSVSFMPGREHAIFQRFVEYLVEQLHAEGIGHGRAVVETSLSMMSDHLSDGTVDLYFDSPFPVAFVCRQSRARPFLRWWKRGIVEYASVIFARRDSGFESVTDLNGSVIAFGEPFSTSSFLMPKAALMAAGQRVSRYEDPAAEVPPDRVGYVFSNDAENTMIWVLKRRIAAGAVNRNYFVHMAGTRMDELEVLLETPPVARGIACHRESLEPSLVEAIERALLRMPLSHEGRDALDQFEETTQFDRFPDGPEQALAPIRDLLQYVEEDLGG